MKNRVNIFILLIINFFYCFELNAQQYYWHNATKYEVEPIHSKSFVLIGTDSCNTKEFLASYGLQIQHINKTKIPNGVNNSKAYHWAIANNNTQSIKALEQVLYAAPEFRAGRDTVFISNFFYVKLKRLEDVALLEKVAKETNSVIVKQNNFMPNWWIISAEGNINRAC